MLLGSISVENVKVSDGSKSVKLIDTTSKPPCRGWLNGALQLFAAGTSPVAVANVAFGEKHCAVASPPVPVGSNTMSGRMPVLRSIETEVMFTFPVLVIENAPVPPNVDAASPPPGVTCISAEATPCSSIVISIKAEPCNPPESVTAAVIVWAPGESVSEDMEAPLSNTPSMLDCHDTLPLRSPSSSLAMAVKLTSTPSSKLAPSVGDVMVTTGLLLPAILSVMLSDPGRPPLSNTCAVMICAPPVRLALTDAPVSRMPSMLDVHAISDAMSPSSRSLAMPVKGIRSVSSKLLPSAGAVIVTTGAVFGKLGSNSTTMVLEVRLV